MKKAPTARRSNARFSMLQTSREVSGAVQAAERQKLEDFLTEQRNRELSIQQFEQ